MLAGGYAGTAAAQGADTGDEVNAAGAGNGGSGSVETSGAISTGDLGGGGVVGNTVIAGDVTGPGASLDGGNVDVNSSFAIGNSGGPATIDASGGDFADVSFDLDEGRSHHDSRDITNERGGNNNPPDFSS